MEKKYVVNCIAITDKHGNVHYDEKITYQDDGKAITEPVVLGIDMFDQAQLDHYLKSGHLVPFEREKQVKEVTEADKKTAELTVKYLKLTGKKSVPQTWNLKRLQEEVQKLAQTDKVKKEKQSEQFEKELQAKKGS